MPVSAKCMLISQSVFVTTISMHTFRRSYPIASDTKCVYFVV